jgi:hypothetical protein
MRVEAQVSGPGVEHSGQAELRAEALRVFAEREQRLAAGGKERVEEESTVAQRDAAKQVVGHREDDVEVGVGKSRKSRRSIQRVCASDWQAGQWRFLHEWNTGRWKPQSTQTSSRPPRTGVRQFAIARSTLRWSSLSAC